MTNSSATATWEGGLRTGKGQFSAKSGAFQGAYTFATRFESAKGTTPEELIAAAHAACFSMALNAALEKAGTTPERISTTATASFDIVGGAAKITKVKLETQGKVPGLDQAAFARAAEGAKEGCAVSQALKGNVAIELDARLA